jgi:hypothetical protein
MFRYALVAMIGLVAGSAMAQQQNETPATSPAAPAPNAVVSMEEPLPGDHWTYEVRDEITGKVSATRDNVVTEVTPADITVRWSILGSDDRGGLNIYDRSWNLKNSGPWKYHPTTARESVRRFRSAEPGIFELTTSTPETAISGNGPEHRRSSVAKR